jgi:hypothetical protein
LIIAAACGGSSGEAPRESPATPTARKGPSDAELAAQREHEHHEEIAAAHRKLEDAQQEALSASCPDPKPASAHERCLPGCYTTEAADARATPKTKGSLEIERIVCESPDGADAPPILVDELAKNLTAKPSRGRAKPHKKHSWQAELEAKLRDSKQFAKGSSLVVTGAWHTMKLPSTHESMRCVAVSQYVAAPKGLDACGSIGDAACEAAGNAAARAINVVHYRIAEARTLQAAHKSEACQQAALEAVAVSRGFARWRQYMKLNEGVWDKRDRYRTRFDGVVDEDTLAAKIQAMGSDAETLHGECGGPAGAPTTTEQEQSFHTCW